MRYLKKYETHNLEIDNSLSLNDIIDILSKEYPEDYRKEAIQIMEELVTIMLPGHTKAEIISKLKSAL
jgi:hypothetical protein